VEDGEEIPPALQLDYRAVFRENLKNQDSAAHSLVEELAANSREPLPPDLPAPLLALRDELLRAEIDPALARDLVERVWRDTAEIEWADTAYWKTCAARLLEREIHVCGPIRIPDSRPHVVALIGPTGVGKTTTIAKLAADFRLRKQRRVGLITVDTYRIAAVEQLRTYAEIIDLPMEVVSTPREMRLAVDRLSGLDLILIDTAGRSPRDEVRIQELKSLLVEAQADEVHLVLSSAAGTSSLINATQRFRQVGVTAILLTKLDEAAGLGGIVSLLQSSRLPLSYLTDGQNVPDDIRAAEGRELAGAILGLAPVPVEG
jgi:flagellar biosynthesis protein FlhF